MKSSPFRSARWRLVLAFSLLMLVCLIALSLYLEHLDWILVLSAVVAAVIAAGLVFILMASIIGPLREITARLNSMARGEINQKMSSIPTSEAGEAIVAFNQMASLISNLIAQATAEKDRFSIILSNMADGIFVTDSQARVTLINRAAQRMFKLNEEDAVGHSFIEATHDYELYNVVRRCLDSGQQQSGLIETKANRLYLGVVATPFQGHAGCILLLQDVTEIRRLETVRRDFVANISHELRTPISSLKALAETLNEGAIEDPAVAKEFLERINVEANKLAQMTQELGELSSIESDEPPLVMSAVKMADVIASAVGRLSTQATRAGIEMAVRVLPGLPSVTIDEGRIERVLVNLIHNSIKFTPPGGRITVSAERGKDSVVISVADTGVGINPADLPRIFERFYKADKACSGGGTGLGLAIARHTVEAHGGRIWAESTPGKGTVIHFSLPLEPQI